MAYHPEDHGQEHLGFLQSRDYLRIERQDERTAYVTTDRAQEYIVLFSKMYGALFDDLPGFRL